MAKAGLAFESQLYQDSGESPTAVVNPYALKNPVYNIGVDALQRGMADMAVAGNVPQAGLRETQFTMPEMRQPPGVWYNPGKQSYYVAGREIAADDAATLLESEQYLGTEAPPPPQNAGWQRIDPTSYAQVLEGIRNPSFSRMLGKGWDIGTQQLKGLYGSALQVAGADTLGGQLRANSEEELAKLAPFNRDVAEGVTVDWFATTLGQQGPMLLESVVTSLVGAMAGSAAAGPAGTVLGGIAGVLGKKAAKEKIMAAAEKYAAAKAAGKMLPKTDPAWKVLRNAGAVAGATIGNFAGGMAMGAGDVYQESGNRLASVALSVPYAALDTLFDYAIVNRALKGGRPALPAGAGLADKAVEYGVKRFGAGLAVAGLAEGAAETGQEALVMAPTDIDFGSEEAVNRFLNSFAAGFAVGGLLGGVANLRSNKPANLLENKPPEQPPGFPALPPPPTRPGLPPPAETFGLEGPVVLEGEVVDRVYPYLTGPPPTGPQTFDQTSSRNPWEEGVIPAGAPEPTLGLPQPPQSFEGAAPGQQGVLNIATPGQPLTSRELDARMTPTEYSTPMEMPPPGAPNLAPLQGALQFSTPTPEPTAAPTNPVLRQRLLAAQRQQEFDAANQQATGMTAMREYPLAEAQRELQDIPPPPPFTVLPRTPNAPAPQQGRLKLGPKSVRRGQPSRAMKLMRGRPQAEETTPTTADMRAAGQLDLPFIGKEVTPEVAAETWEDKRPKNVRAWDKLEPESQEKWMVSITGGKATPEARRKINTEDSALKLKQAERRRAEKERAKTEAVKAKEAENAVQEQSAAAVPAQVPPETGRPVGERVPSKKGTAGTRLRKEEAGQAETNRKNVSTRSDVRQEPAEQVAKGPPLKKDEEAAEQAAAVSEPKPEAPVMIEVEQNGARATIEGNKLLEEISADMDRFRRLLQCLK